MILNNDIPLFYIQYQNETEIFLELLSKGKQQCISVVLLVSF